MSLDREMEISSGFGVVSTWSNSPCILLIGQLGERTEEYSDHARLNLFTLRLVIFLEVFLYAFLLKMSSSSS